MARVGGGVARPGKDLAFQALQYLAQVLRLPVGRGRPGRGYATEIGLALRDYAFGALGLTRLISLIEPENAASRRVAETMGLRYEGDTVRPGGRTMWCPRRSEARGRGLVTGARSPCSHEGAGTRVGKVLSPGVVSNGG
jgi:hypothetical protein